MTHQELKAQLRQFSVEIQIAVLDAVVLAIDWADFRSDTPENVQMRLRELVLAMKPEALP